ARPTTSTLTLILQSGHRGYSVGSASFAKGTTCSLPLRPRRVGLSFLLLACGLPPFFGVVMLGKGLYVLGIRVLTHMPVSVPTPTIDGAPTVVGTTLGRYRASMSYQTQKRSLEPRLDPDPLRRSRPASALTLFRPGTAQED